MRRNGPIGEGIWQLGDEILEAGFIYAIAVAGKTKIGKARVVEECLAAAKRWDSAARILSCWPTLEPLKIESALHLGLGAWRYDPDHEQFNLPEDVLGGLLGLDDYEFLIWGRLGFDPLALQVPWPRVADPNGHRAWECLYFPDDRSMAWAAFCSDRKPAYSEVARLWKSGLQFRRHVLTQWNSEFTRACSIRLNIQNELLERRLNCRDNEGDFAI
jgi:hypothetical protein